MSDNNRGNDLKLKALLFSTESLIFDIFPRLFPGHQIESMSNSDQLSDLDHIRRRYINGGFDILILTNLGIPAKLVKQHISLLPKNHKFKVLLISGYFDNELKRLCDNSSIQTMSMPFKPEDFQKIISEMSSKVGQKL